MKKLLIGMFAAASFASAEGYSQADRIMDMQKMATAMQDIQTGFFYNNIDIVKVGVKELKKTIERVGPTNEELNNKDIYEQWLNNNIKMTNKIKKKIIRRAELIEDRFSTGDPVQALQAYSSIAEKCMKCHVQLRKW